MSERLWVWLGLLLGVLAWMIAGVLWMLWVTGGRP